MKTSVLCLILSCHLTLAGKGEDIASKGQEPTDVCTLSPRRILQESSFQQQQALQKEMSLCAATLTLREEALVRLLNHELPRLFNLDGESPQAIPFSNASHNTLTKIQHKNPMLFTEIPQYFFLPLRAYATLKQTLQAWINQQMEHQNPSVAAFFKIWERYSSSHLIYAQKQGAKCHERVHEL